MLDFLNPLLETFKTGSGFWHPIIWIIVAVIALLIAYIVRGFGNKNYKADSGQTQSFLSGNPEYEKEQMHVAGSNVYWGFLESLKWLYNILNKMHNGYINDYVLWFVVILAILFIVLGVI